MIEAFVFIIVVSFIIGLVAGIGWLDLGDLTFSDIKRMKYRVKS